MSSISSSREVYRLDKANLDSFSDRELWRIFWDSPSVRSNWQGTKIARIRHDLVVKGGYVTEWEAQTMDFVSENTFIALPQVHRIFDMEPGPFFSDDTYDDGAFTDQKCPAKLFKHYIVMDFIDGYALNSRIWRVLPAEVKEEITDAVAAIIMQLQTLEMPKPTHVEYDGFLSGKWFIHPPKGPFENVQELEDSFNERLYILQEHVAENEKISPFKFTKIVLVHQNISFENIMLGKNGQVWLIDWSSAAALPPAFEFASIKWNFRPLEAEEGASLSHNAERIFTSAQYQDFLTMLLSKLADLEEESDKLYKFLELTYERIECMGKSIEEVLEEGGAEDMQDESTNEQESGAVTL